MNKICTTIEQSKKLLELGIDRKSSDMYYWCGSDLRIGGYRAQDEELDIPAWSLSRLLELMPQTIDKDDKWLLRLQRCYHRDVSRFICTYPNTKSTPICDNPLDAAFEMVVWLKENGKI